MDIKRERNFHKHKGRLVNKWSARAQGGTAKDEEFLVEIGEA